MDLFQSKLTKSEWESIEVPVHTDEKQILQMIVEGYHDLNISRNNTISLLAFLKIPYSENIEAYIFDNYFNSEIAIQANKYDLTIDLTEKYNSKKPIKKGDSMRF
jgi:hypothetical protein